MPAGLMCPTTMIDIPILRSGRPYTSKETLDLRDYATGQPVARLSIANPGLISRDLLQDAWTPLQDLRVKDILGMLREAARCFMTARCRWVSRFNRPPTSSSRSPQRPACRIRFAGRTWRRSNRPCSIWRRSSTA